MEIMDTTFTKALQKSRTTLPNLKQFLVAQGFDPSIIQKSSERMTEHYMQKKAPNNHIRNVQQNYQTSQDIVLTNPDLTKINNTYHTIIQFQTKKHPITHSAPLYLISNLEKMKISLINTTTNNTKIRATKFAKHNNIAIDHIHTASQNTFYILPTNTSTKVDNYKYNNTYDKSTINKIAHVVMTIEYKIEH